MTVNSSDDEGEGVDYDGDLLQNFKALPFDDGKRSPNNLSRSSNIDQSELMLRAAMFSNFLRRDSIGDIF